MPNILLGKTKDVKARFSPKEGCESCGKDICIGHNMIIQYLYRMEEGRKVHDGSKFFCGDVCYSKWSEEYFNQYEDE
ncbi:hypothetical protein KW800_00910 [Candidatus Parcubacteria bacterium]|nr:hypothetical protein [Candidatus Parcubacteria bacterium]